MGDSDLTDGTWLWPQGLVHYVAVHGVALPQEFVAHVSAKGGVVSDLSDDLRSELIDQGKYAVDVHYWSAWFATLEHVDAG
jgi:hypothetical protein